MPVLNLLKQTTAPGQTRMSGRPRMYRCPRQSPDLSSQATSGRLMSHLTRPSHRLNHPDRQYRQE